MRLLQKIQKVMQFIICGYIVHLKVAALISIKLNVQMKFSFWANVLYVVNLNFNNKHNNALMLCQVYNVKIWLLIWADEI